MFITIGSIRCSKHEQGGVLALDIPIGKGFFHLWEQWVQLLPPAVRRNDPCMAWVHDGDFFSPPARLEDRCAAPGTPSDL